MTEGTPVGICSSAVLLTHGWASDVSIYWDRSGTITECREGYLDASLPRAAGPIIPGMINLHSHAFQHRLAGRTHVFSSQADDFWSWREAMYRELASLDPDQLFETAASLYTGMLHAGYTSVCEFHYVHNRLDGSTYSDPDAMGKAIIAAADASGIGLTLLPVFYEYSGFGRQQPVEGQRPFTLAVDAYLAMMDRLQSEVGTNPRMQLGYAPHSLRAVGRESLGEILQHRKIYMPGAPLHMHVAEQPGEVDDCLQHYGHRPVSWLFEEQLIDPAWSLIHATHIDHTEVSLLAASQATVGLCPTTEADLGDGVFPFRSFLELGGSFGIGSDSNVSISPFDELRLLEYVQRLWMLKRNVDGTTKPPGAGTKRYMQAVLGGGKASGRRVGQLTSGYAADFLVLNAEHPQLTNRTPDEQLNTAVFSAGSPAVRSVFVAGGEVRVP